MRGSTLSDTPLLSDAEVAAAIAHLKTEGYCLLKNRIPREVALSIGESLLAQHEEAHSAEENAGTFQLIFGLFNTDERTWQYMPAHPDCIKVAGHFLGGGQVRAIEGISGRTLPGARRGGLHKDCAQDFTVLPECCWGINGIWMLSDFTETNGATRIVPKSHVEQRTNPLDGASWEDVIERESVPVLGQAGDVFLWHMGTLHQSGANDSDEVRVSFNCGYLPAWFNHRIMGGHQPVWPSEYQKMPSAVREYLPRVTGYDRHDAYEYHARPRPPIEAEPHDAWARRAAASLGVSVAVGATHPINDTAVDAAVVQLERDGYCVLEASLEVEAAAQFSRRILDSYTKHAAEAGATLFGMMNREPAAWAIGAAHPATVRIARRVVGERVRVVDVATAPLLPRGPAAPETELCAHKSARAFEVGLPQSECPWLVEATWPLAADQAGDGCAVTLLPGSHRSRHPGPAPTGTSRQDEKNLHGPITVQLKPGSVLLSHGGLWMQRDLRTSLPLCSGSASLHILYGATWWNHWTEEDMEAVWPETYESMPATVQALMPGLLAAERKELYESAFDQSDFNRERFERRRREAKAATEAVSQRKDASATTRRAGKL